MPAVNGIGKIRSPMGTKGKCLLPFAPLRRSHSGPKGFLGNNAQMFTTEAQRAQRILGFPMPGDTGIGKSAVPLGTKNEPFPRFAPVAKTYVTPKGLKFFVCRQMPTNKKNLLLCDLCVSVVSNCIKDSEDCRHALSQPIFFHSPPEATISST